MTSLLLVGTVLCGALQPYTGRLIDRLGARSVACASMLVHALGLLLLASASGPVSLGAGFLVVRVGGISGTFLAQDAVLTKWWLRRRGTAVAVQRCLMSVLAVSAVPMLIGAALPRLGWRATLAVLAAPLIAAVPTAGVLLLPTPECVGLRPDGDAGPQADAPAPAPAGCAAADGEELLPLFAAPPAERPGAAPAPAPARCAPAPAEQQWSVREAMRTRVFWVLLLIGFVVCCSTGGITAHAALIAADAGLDLRAMARIFLVPSAAVSLAANLTAGRALDRDAVSVRALFAASELTLAAAALAAAATGGAGTPGRRRALAALWGALYGGGTAVYYLLYKLAFAKFYGRQSIGEVMGAANLAMFAAIGLGPVLYGVARDAQGSYAPALRASAATCAAAAAASWALVAPPGRRPGSGGGEEEVEEAERAERRQAEGGRAPLLAAEGGRGEGEGT